MHMQYNVRTTFLSLMQNDMQQHVLPAAISDS